MFVILKGHFFKSRKSVYHSAAEVSDFENTYLESQHNQSLCKWRLSNDLRHSVSKINTEANRR